MTRFLGLDRPQLHPRHLTTLAMMIGLMMQQQAYADVIPNAGTVLREIVPSQKTEIPTQKNDVTLPESLHRTDISDDTTPITVSSIHITGNTLYTTAQLSALVADLPQGTHTLADLQRATAKISDYYHQHGYFLARAFLPQQEMTDGVLTIAVAEGKLGQVQLDNQSHVSDRTARAFLNALPLHQALQKQSADRALLLLSDLAGSMNASLSAGANLGETTLGIDLTPANIWSGRISLDNNGSVYTGRYRANGTLNADSLFGLGEHLSAQLLASNADLLYGQLSAQLPVGGSGLKLGMNVSHTTYALGDRFAVLDAIGRSNTFNINTSYPLVRTQPLNVNLQADIEYRQLRDDIRQTQTDSDKNALLARATLSATSRDDVGFGGAGGGISQAQLIVTQGHLNLQTPSVLQIDQVGARTSGTYEKYELQLSRLQALPQKFSLLVQAQAQWASRNLDSSEKLSLGTIRAYPTGEGIGDEGWLSSVTLRYDASPSLNPSLFYDLGQIKINARPYANDKNERYLAGVGIGLAGGVKAFDYSMTVAWRETSAAISEPDKKPRLLLQGGWHF